MSYAIPLVTTSQQTVFEEKLHDDETGLSVRIIQAPSGRSRLKSVRCILYSAVYPLNSKRKKWISCLFKESKKKKLNTIHDDEFIKSSGNEITNIPLLSSSQVNDHDEMLFQLDRRDFYCEAVKGDNSVPEYPKRDIADLNSCASDFDVINPPLLVWGDKLRKVSGQMGLRDIKCIQKGKVTRIAQLSNYPSSHILSIVAKPGNSFTFTRNETLDIEAPTELDRDKFALAFSKYLCVPIEEDPMGIV